MEQTVASSEKKLRTITPLKLVCLLIAFILMIAARFVQGGTSLSREGVQVIILIVAYLIMLVSECIPMGTASLLIIFAQVAVGVVANINEVMVNGGSQLIIYTICAYGIGAAVSKVPVATRIVLFFMKRFGKSTTGIIAAFSTALAVVSAFVSNFPALIVFLSIGMSFLQVFKNEEDKRKTGRVLMLALPLGAVCGGMMTPVGNSCMMMASEFLNNAGMSVNFAQWMAIGVPLCVVLLPLLLFLMLKMYPPAKMSKEEVQNFIDTVELPDRMESTEKKLLIVMGILILFWIAGSFFAVNAVFVTLGGVLLMIMPGINILTWKELNESVNWGAILMYLAILSLCALISTTGVTSWLLDGFMMVLPEGASPSLIILIQTIFICALLVIMPNCPAVTALLGLPLIELASKLGFHAGVLVLPMAMASNACFIVPFDLVWLMGYTKGFYKMSQMAKWGILACIILAIVFTVWFPVIFKILGLL